MKIIRLSNDRPFSLGSLSVALFFLLLLAESCARVGDPLPPLLFLPKRTTDLTVRQIDNEIHLRIPKPTIFTEGSEVRRLREIRIFRMVRGKNQGLSVPVVDEKLFRRQSSVLTDLPYNLAKVPVSGDTILYREPIASYADELFYAVEFVGQKGGSNGISNIVELDPLAIPSMPTGLRAQVLEDRIRLEWDRSEANADGSRPACLAGYRIYRSVKNPPEFNAPLLPEVLTDNRFDDMDMVYGRDVSYAVRIVGCSKISIAESRLSESILVRPKDIFSPAVPSRLEAFDLAEGISLRWDSNREADLAGYRLYRSESAEDRGGLLQPEPIREDVYQDLTGNPGKTYYYRLSAVDRQGNESNTTEPVACQRAIRPKSESPK
jgi:fibronectin type 3 domain-containing protein